MKSIDAYPETGSILNRWYTIENVEKMDTFLSTIVGNEDHWMYVASNGGLTAGRVSSELSLFPYYTQDKLIDLAHTTGPVTLIRSIDSDNSSALWHPFEPGSTCHSRHMSKKLDGTQISFCEENANAGLKFSYAWGFSRKRGFVRRSTIRNTGTRTVSIELVDGLQNLSACDVDPVIFNRFSNLLDAYKRSEQVPESSLRLIYLNSIPTDRAEPLESLRCTTVWSTGLPVSARFLHSQQLDEFRNGGTLRSESETRGERVSALDFSRLELLPGEEQTWYFVADVGVSIARVSHLEAFLRNTSESKLAEILEEDLEETSSKLVSMVASADGLQLTRDTMRTGRHYSNVLFNIMRGGVFPYVYSIPKTPFLEYLSKANPGITNAFRSEFAKLPEAIDRSSLMKLVEGKDAGLERLASEYLPLAFSRRHGDPSRPWNNFSIRVRDERGDPVLAYQGNWRDIFQNWEALSYSFPEYIDGMIARFLNATTADGYNPYRLTYEGFDWEKIEPDEPWSNIGYWGDHQLIYLLRLLESSGKLNPKRLKALLGKEIFGYARIPYRIRPYEEILENPRDSVEYDDKADRDINTRIETMGSDGKLLPSPHEGILHVSMMEKLLVPLLAKLSNFVPGGGIWMNTQRPEWNDANNALAGYGLSVVTLAYAHRYINFLLELLDDGEAEDSFLISSEIAGLLFSQTEIFNKQDPSLALEPKQLRQFMDSLGQSASDYRVGLYDEGLSGEKFNCSRSQIVEYLSTARNWVAESLRANRREDGLFHSYNLLQISKDGMAGIQYLYEMLEGQVAILSANLLSPEEALQVLDALRESKLYREDQNSYILYPDRYLPNFLDKNRISKEKVASSLLLKTLATDPGQAVVERDVAGDLCFRGTFRNSNDLMKAIDELPESYQLLLEDEPTTLLEIFEELFNHHSYTGRSGTFFAYEGLGSIYWHMVSKLVLAIQEIALSLDGADLEMSAQFQHHYQETLDGIGINKSPSHYGAFPCDAYSHTPKHAGAQQPGMTGQVKEDILSRWGELGVRIENGTLGFDPVLLNADELLQESQEFTFIGSEGHESSVHIPAGSLAFTVCQVPVILSNGSTPVIEVFHNDKTHTKYSGTLLPLAVSREIFGRTGKVNRIHVSLPGLGKGQA